MNDDLDAQLVIDALKDQRNSALDAAAFAAARSIHFQRENKRLREEIEELKKKVAS